MGNIEKNVKETLWNLIRQQALSITNQYCEYFSFNENSEYIFLQKFDDYTDMVKSNFMKKDVVDLDRHKVAAIIICSIIESNVIKTNFECAENELFTGNEKIAINIGLSYMKDTLIELLGETSEAGKFKDFYFPEALMCDTDYITILCRNLYYAKKNFVLNPIEIANTLFLLENLSLIKANVDLSVVKEQCRRL